MNIYKEHSQNICYEPEHYNEETQPVHTVKNDSCKRWFYVQWPKKNCFTGLLSCPGCNAFFKRVRCLNKRNDIPISSKVARLDVSSKYQHKFLSPLREDDLKSEYNGKLTNIKTKCSTGKKNLTRRITECWNAGCCNNNQPEVPGRPRKKLGWSWRRKQCRYNGLIERNLGKRHFW